MNFYVIPGQNWWRASIIESASFLLIIHEELADFLSAVLLVGRWIFTSEVPSTTSGKTYSSMRKLTHEFKAVRPLFRSSFSIFRMVFMRVAISLTVLSSLLRVFFFLESDSAIAAILLKKGLSDDDDVTEAGVLTGVGGGGALISTDWKQIGFNWRTSSIVLQLKWNDCNCRSYRSHNWADNMNGFSVHSTQENASVHFIPSLLHGNRLPPHLLFCTDTV